MRDPKHKDKSESRDLETQIRRGRKFGLTEAVGRQAGGILKGASPVAPAQQLLLQIEEILARNLADNEGSLTHTIMAQLEGNPPLLARHFDDATGALREYLDGILDTRTNLVALVRQADARWGREYDERPRFDKPDQAPHPDDPYTLAAVTSLLTEFRASLTP